MAYAPDSIAFKNFQELYNSPGLAQAVEKKMKELKGKLPVTAPLPMLKKLDTSATHINTLHPAHKMQGFKPDEGLPKRNGKYNTLGKKVSIQVNQFKVLTWPEEDVYQYDIKITQANGDALKGEGASDGLIKKLWNFKDVVLYRKMYKAAWIHDGKKIAWCKVAMSPNKLGTLEHTIYCDLDKDKRQPGEEKRDENCYNVTFKQTTNVRMAAISGFLNGNMTFTNDVFESINFLDHVLRQKPLEKYTQVKRSFFSWDMTLSAQDRAETARIDRSLDFQRGVYASIRMCEKTAGGTGLAVNLDVANGLFWKGLHLPIMVRNWLMDHCSHKMGGFNSAQAYPLFLNPMAHKLQPIFNHHPKDPQGLRPKMWLHSDPFKELRKFVKMKVVIKFPKYKGDKEGKMDTEFAIKDFLMKDDGPDVETGVRMNQHLNKFGSTAKTTFFETKIPGSTLKRKVSCFDYWKEKHNYEIIGWRLPMVELYKIGYFPMEVLHIAPHQRFPYKTTPDQTAAMIKAAVKRPNERIEHINHGLRMLNWKEDKYLAHFGLKIDEKMTWTEARVLPNPEICFAAKKKLNPRLSGRWSLAGVKFLKPNPQPLTSWGIGVIENPMPHNQKPLDPVALQNFIKTFIEVYVSHGGQVPNKSPVILYQRQLDIPDFVQELRKQTATKCGALPQILMFMLPDSNSDVYNRTKRNMECRWGLVSQMVRYEKVRKPTQQLCSNILMKFNCKLGGATNMVGGKEKDGGHNFFGKMRTMIVGADVTHPAHGSPIASVASLSMNADKGCQRFWAAAQTNGKRVEMIMPHVMDEMLMGFFPQWMKEVGEGNGPQHLFYFRDGVSEGQYEQVLEEEVKAMKAAILTKYKSARILFTVVVCSKRHKIRFFPKKGDPAAADQNQNPVPGTLVERDVTHPFENDFYLNSHSAIQGTARPTHYHVILDEAKVAPNDLHMMIYQHCYQYQRSTTPVSLYPAVYYAHLAAARARAHEAASPVVSRFGFKQEEYKQDKHLHEAVYGPKIYDEMTDTEKTEFHTRLVDEMMLPLMKFAQGDKTQEDKLKHSMWYI